MPKKLMLLLLGFLSLHLGATTYYVAKMGNDGNPGSASQPWLTIRHSTTIAAAGDTVWVKAGTYVEDTIDINTNAGTAGNPIVFRSYDGWNTTISGSIRAFLPYTYIENFRIVYGPDCGNTQVVRFYGSHCALRGCEVTVSPPHSQYVTGVSNARVNTNNNDTIHGLVYDHNTIHGFGYNGNHHGIYAKGTHGTITNNICYDNAGCGIHLYDEGDSVNYYEVAYNVCRDQVDGDGILVSGNHNWIHDNLVYGNAAGHGIKLYQGDHVHDNEVSNNVCHDNVWGIAVNPTGANLIRNNILLHNGFIYGGTFHLRQLYVRDSTADVTLDYNCYYPEDGASFAWGDGGERSFTKYQIASGQDAHGIRADPLFVDTAAHNFRLADGSPCIDAGDPTTLAGYDIDGISTPQGEAVDMGAYEYHTFHPTRDSGRDQSPPAPSSGKTIAIAPNPQSGGRAAVRYSLPKAGLATLNVFDVTGRTVLSQTLAAGRTGTASLDLRKLEAGVYLVKVTAEGFSTTQKLVVEH